MVDNLLDYNKPGFCESLRLPETGPFRVLYA